MKIVGCDLRTLYRQIAMLDTETRVGIEATGHTRWFERLLADLGRELLVAGWSTQRSSEV